MTQIIEALDDISARYDALFVDLWGCLHNGLEPFPDAVNALQRFRAGGGKVVLLTNSPRPRASVEVQLEQIRVPKDCWDTITTSGDSARAAMFQGVVGEKVFHIGKKDEEGFFTKLKIIEDAADISLVSLQDAEGIVCTSPEDPLALPEVYRPQFLYAKQKGLKLLCANPDIVVDRGERREWCAGALAALYTEMGGESLYFGKPHPPIYDLAHRRLLALGTDYPDHRILCIGDGIATDIQGATGEDLDSLFISGGLAATETKTVRQPDPAALDAYLGAAQLTPRYSIGFLR